MIVNYSKCQIFSLMVKYLLFLRYFIQDWQPITELKFFFFNWLFTDVYFLFPLCFVGSPGPCRSISLTGSVQLSPECRLSRGTHTEKDGSNDPAVEDHEQQTIRSFLPKQLWMLHGTVQVITQKEKQIYVLHCKSNNSMGLWLLATSLWTTFVRETRNCLEMFAGALGFPTGRRGS